MKNLHLGIMGLSFVTILVSLYYGISIQNAQDNFLIEHLNVDDGFSYNAVNEVPILGFKAAFITLFFLIINSALQSYILFKTNLKSVKRFAIGALFCFGIILIFDFLTLTYPHDFNFKNYGMIWVLLSLSAIFINGISLFLKKIN